MVYRRRDDLTIHLHTLFWITTSPHIWQPFPASSYSEEFRNYRQWVSWHREITKLNKVPVVCQTDYDLSSFRSPRVATVLRDAKQNDYTHRRRISCRILCRAADSMENFCVLIPVVATADCLADCGPHSKLPRRLQDLLAARVS